MKLYAIIAGLILLAGGIGYGVSIVRKASRVDQAEARADAAEKGRASDMAEVVKRLDADKAWREGFAAKFDAIDKRFDGIVIPKPAALVQNHEVPSVQGECVSTGVSDTFVGVFNDASKP